MTERLRITLQLLKYVFSIELEWDKHPTKAIETNVTDDSITLLKKKTANGWQSIKEQKASANLAKKAN